MALIRRLSLFLPQNRRDASTVLLVILVIGMKVWLLLTSQSLVDGDEAVEGLMAMDILAGKGNPLYAYGIRYGIGAGIEAHLGACFFFLFGISSVSMKSVGLMLWLLQLLLVWLTAHRIGGKQWALVAIALFGACPSYAHWGLKVAGGHQVAVLLCLLMICLIEAKIDEAYIIPLAPLAAFAHPVAIPFVCAIGVYLLIQSSSKNRTILSLVFAILLSSFLFWPEEAGTWDPSVRNFAPLLMLKSLWTAMWTLFSPNLSAVWIPKGMQLVVSIVWYSIFCVACIVCRERRLLLYALSSVGVLFIVDQKLFAARHLVILIPMACIIIAGACTRWKIIGRVVIGVLCLTGVGVQSMETQSPYIYGAGRQSFGLEREQVANILATLEKEGIQYVYNTEAMLHWVLMFESKGKIHARWIGPNDRRLEYAVVVDRARQQGARVAIVYRIEGAKFAVFPDPDDEIIKLNFPSAL